VFSLGSVTSKSAVSACQADGATVATAIAAYNANNGILPTSTNDLLTASTSNGGPYLQSWPSNPTHYAFALSATGVLEEGLPGAATNPWKGAATCTLGASGGVGATVK
ncbi:MAG: hypothetical protein HIU57_07655, partial [Acidobacteria bacterium]|nr:hypothetical protein [Acidobacteriota bacterium]